MCSVTGEVIIPSRLSVQGSPQHPALCEMYDLTTFMMFLEFAMTMSLKDLLATCLNRWLDCDAPQESDLLKSRFSELEGVHARDLASAGAAMQALQKSTEEERIEYERLLQVRSSV